MSGVPAQARPLHLHIVLLLATVAAGVVAAGFWIDRGARTGGPEAPVVRYAEAVAREDLRGALSQLAPSIRGSSAPFVEWQLGNRYTILESAVRGSSLESRLTGNGDRETEVVVTMEIQELGKAPWRATEELPVGQVEGQWYLLKPPLKPTQD